MRSSRSDEFASSALSSCRSDEHVTVKHVVALCGRVEAEAVLAVLAYNDAGHLIVGSIDCVSFRHGKSVHRQGRRPLAVCALDCERLGVDGVRCNNTDTPQRSSCGRSSSASKRLGNGEAVSWLAP